ncbi:hypothetical protein B0H14DRAFT_3167479, partial [Mycena olivaceomarginata]
MKALQDSNGVEAGIQIAYLSPDLLFSVEVLEFAEAKARTLLPEWLGRNCFDDDGPCVGKFYDILLRRLYMCVLQAPPHSSDAAPLPRGQPRPAVLAGRGSTPPPSPRFAPSATLFDPETEKRCYNHARSDLADTAALAAFKLWGRRPQAEQLLRIAIIVRHTQPKAEETMMFRGANGAEVAHDYSWIAQDRWMEPDVLD